MPELVPILDRTALSQRIERMAQAIQQRCGSQENLALIGVYRRGVPLSERLYTQLKPSIPGLRIGRVDISLYRDDLRSLTMMPKLIGSEMNFDLDGMHVILCDEVLHTGRTSRAAIEEVLAHGRPHCVELAALIDREGREFPIQANYVGERVDITPDERIQVHFVEVDGEDAVYVQKGGARA